MRSALRCLIVILLATGCVTVACNDPALSAQVRPLKHTPRRGFSYPVPDAGAGAKMRGQVHFPEASANEPDSFSEYPDQDLRLQEGFRKQKEE
jgi:hypothetical protein